jgi:Fe-S cluster assembly ATPase SufC
LPLDSKITDTGLVLLQFSRAKDLKCIAIGYSFNDLVTEKLLKIGKSGGNEKRRELIQFLRTKKPLHIFNWKSKNYAVFKIMNIVHSMMAVIFFYIGTNPFFL